MDFDIGAIFAWLFEEINILVVSIYGWLLDGLVSLIDSIPVPDFMLAIGSVSLPSNVAFYANMFEMQAGLTIMVSAYTARFIVRRLPFIG